MPLAYPLPVTLDDPTPSPRPLLLLVEDELTLLRALARSFELAQFDVLTAEDVPSALSHWDSHGERIAMVVSDVQMPGPAVEELIAHVRQQSPAVPILLTSGHLRGTEDRIQRLMGSVDAFLPKPMRLKELHLLVQRLLAEPRRA